MEKVYMKNRFILQLFSFLPILKKCKHLIDRGASEAHSMSFKGKEENSEHKA